MKKLIFIFLFFGIATLYIGCSDNNPSAPQLNQSDQVTKTLDKKPAPNLIGVMDLTFVYNPAVSDVAWEGTIDFEGYPTYGIRFHHTGGEIKGQSNHFEESFEIFDGSGVLLAGPDAGVEPIANKPPAPVKYMSNGVVEVANAPFEMWLGRNTHMSGIVIFDQVTGVPLTAPGTFRIN